MTNLLKFFIKSDNKLLCLFIRISHIYLTEPKVVCATNNDTALFAYPQQSAGFIFLILAAFIRFSG